MDTHIDIWKKRPFSWSQLSSFTYDPKQWYERYILNVPSVSNAQMDFGKEVGERLASDPNFLPEIPRYKVMEKKLEARIGDISLIGYLDSFCPKTKAFAEYKTSSSKQKWTKKSANAHGQMLFYLFLIWKNYGVPPEKVKMSLHYIPVSTGGDFVMVLDGEIQHFEVRHTSQEVLKFAGYIKNMHKNMEEYALSTGSVAKKSIAC